MLLRPTTTAAVIFLRFTTTICHHFSSSSAATSNLIKPFSKIPWKHRSKAIQESQKALSDYLHATRCLPYLFADQIASNSPNSLSKIVAKIPFSPSNFSSSFQRFLRYHPINELEFLFESIGLNCAENGVPRSLLPPNTFFLSDWMHFDVVRTLACMGFPWSKLGLLCKEERSMFEINPSDLVRKVNEIKERYGFNGVSLISICLAFPQVLYNEMDGLLSDLKVLFLDYNLSSSVDVNIDAMFEVCEKVRIFYDLGCEMGKIGELLGRSKSIFLIYPKEALVSKIEYFCRLNVEKDQIGLFLLSKSEIFGYDLEDRLLSVSGLLKYFGLSINEIKSLEQKYPHVFGRNRIANLPQVIRSLDLGEWFFHKIKNGDHSLLSTYTIGNTECLDKNYLDNLKKLHAKKTFAYAYASTKLNFLHSIGFGENIFAIKALAQLHSSRSQLQERFDCLVLSGIKYSKLCAILKFCAKILNQQRSFLETKVEFLCNDMGLSLEYLDVFPGYLCYNLEKRIKPRYELHKWLVEEGFCKKKYTLTTIIACSEKAFLTRISRIHPPSAKKWLESTFKKDGGGCYRKKKSVC